MSVICGILRLIAWIMIGNRFARLDDFELSVYLIKLERVEWISCFELWDFLIYFGELC